MRDQPNGVNAPPVFSHYARIVLQSLFRALHETPGMVWPTCEVVSDWKAKSTGAFAELYDELYKYLEANVQQPPLEQEGEADAMGVHRCTGCSRSMLELAELGHVDYCEWDRDETNRRIDPNSICVFCGNVDCGADCVPF